MNMSTPTFAEQLASELRRIHDTNAENVAASDTAFDEAVYAIQRFVGEAHNEDIKRCCTTLRRLLAAARTMGYNNCATHEEIRAFDAAVKEAADTADELDPQTQRRECPGQSTPVE